MGPSCWIAYIPVCCTCIRRRSTERHLSPPVGARNEDADTCYNGELCHLTLEEARLFQALGDH
jgi:hypothetical protein